MFTTEAKPTIAVIFLQPACNMTCTFCVTEDGFHTLTDAQVEALLIQLKQEGYRNVVLGGGEPLVWPGDLAGLVKKAKAMGFFVQIGTNGTVIPEEFVRNCPVDRYVVPLESIDASVHNRMRLYKGRHHQCIIALLNRLMTAGRSVTISTVVTKINYEGLNDLCSFLAAIDHPAGFIHAWHLYMFIPEGRGGAPNAPLLSIPEELYEERVRAVKAMSHPFLIYKRKNMFSSRSVRFYWREGGRIVSRGGYDFQSLPDIKNGALHACRFLQN